MYVIDTCSDRYTDSVTSVITAANGTIHNNRPMSANIRCFDRALQERKARTDYRGELNVSIMPTLVECPLRSCYRIYIKAAPITRTRVVLIRNVKPVPIAVLIYWLKTALSTAIPLREA